MDPECVEEAREEDEESLTLLEILMEGFEARFWELRDDGFDAVDFLNGY